MDERDAGLVLAIAAAGGPRPLAFELGISCEWRRVPAHRILQVEAVTGIPREKLRPDLYRVGVLDEGVEGIMASPETEACFAELEAAGLLVKAGKMRKGKPVYVTTEWSVKLGRDYPAVLEELIGACGDPDELRRVYEQHKDILIRYRQ
jgi:hypothetical protein